MSAHVGLVGLEHHVPLVEHRGAPKVLIQIGITCNKLKTTYVYITYK